MSVIKSRASWKPFEQAWAFDAMVEQAEMFWVPTKVSMSQDIEDWNSKLKPHERNLLTHIFRFFVQADVDIRDGYIDLFLPLFKAPEVRAMLTSYAFMESIHVWAYAYLIDTLGMPEVTYSAFMDYAVMRDKHDYMKRFNTDDPQAVAESLFAYSGLGEGLQLFSSFAILLNFARDINRTMTGMGQMISWSIKDESKHVERMTYLSHQYRKENAHHIDPKRLAAQVRAIAYDMVNIEDRFIDLAFEMGPLNGLTSADTRRFIRFLADRRLQQMGFDPIFGVKDNNLPWFSEVTSSQEHASFFETRSVSYLEGALTGTWSNSYGFIGRLQGGRLGRVK